MEDSEPILLTFTELGILAGTAKHESQNSLFYTMVKSIDTLFSFA